MRLQIICQRFGQVFIGAEEYVTLSLAQDLSDKCSECREYPALFHGTFGDIETGMVIDLVGNCTVGALWPTTEKSRVLQTAVVCVHLRSGIEQYGLALPIAEFGRSDMEDAESVGLVEKEGFTLIHICSMS